MKGDKKMKEETKSNETEKGLCFDTEDMFGREEGTVGEFSPGGFTKGKLRKVFISAVKKDGTAIRVKDQWYEITDRTRNEAGELVKGMKINLYYAMGEKKNFANAIYPVAEASAPAGDMVPVM
jgi:hypothetical protein